LPPTAPTVAKLDSQRVLCFATQRIQELSATPVADKPNAFYVYDLYELDRAFDTWVNYFPTIKPYYAVKCNSDPVLLAELSAMGVCFDCASPAEIDLVLSNGYATPEQILYANPCKSVRDLAFAREKKIGLTTFDSVYELDKIAEIAPNMKCLLRFYAYDPEAQCPLSHKYGSLPDEWISLLERAKTLGLQIVGASFHVGSGAKTKETFVKAIADAKQLYELGRRHGFELNLMDIGGGFTRASFESMAPVIWDAICSHGMNSVPFQWIAEPGRYFAEESATLFTQVIGRRDRWNPKDACWTHDYYLSDSIYGSFNALLYDHLVPTPMVFPHSEDTDSNASEASEEIYTRSTLYGPTCDGLDCLKTDVSLPELAVGDWIYWPKMGAYTLVGASVFNGFGFPFVPKYYL
jgi:ornithine decarboxylase